jgi:hypothetical protein
MRETIASNESIDDALHRGALAEMGAKIKIGHFLGSKISTFPDNSNERIIRKTTIYFHLELIEQNESWRTAEIPEGQSVLMWLKPKMLIKRMETQQSDSHTGLDESQIVNNYLKTLAN